MSKYETVTECLKRAGVEKDVLVAKRMTAKRWLCRADATKTLLRGYQEVKQALSATESLTSRFHTVQVELNIADRTARPSRLFKQGSPLHYSPQPWYLRPRRNHPKFSAGTNPRRIRNDD
ncbi:hypothetical protein J6590_058577 [Homalodisca vitripennis]|nr:hypothetical protein J6590_058577 [Homalodisca vitripennis]